MIAGRIYRCHKLLTLYALVQRIRHVLPKIKIRKDQQKISNESVDKKSQSWAMSRKKDEKMEFRQ